MLNYSRTDVLHIAVLGAVYFLAAKLGLALAPVFGTVTLFWPPSGIALAALLIFGWRLFPAIAIGEFLASLGMGLPLSSVAGISCGNALEGLLGYYLLRQCSGFGDGLKTLRDVGLLFVFGALLSPLVAAVNGAWWVKYAVGGSWGDYL
ncbi:MAG TPA: MASE1 domain-containing protein, partial [Gallionella sp.]|nr:MASE1 domain-containing protein [Gallionella sp.]